MINYYKAAETVLSHRRDLDRARENLTRRRERLVDHATPEQPRAIDCSREYISTHRSSDALEDCLELAEIMRSLATTEETIAEIDRVLGQLDAPDGELLRLWYIERVSKEQIAEVLNYSSVTSIYDKRNKALSRFAVLYFGAGAFASI